MSKLNLGHCHGCLSVDRRLAPIGGYMMIYIKVMEDEIQNSALNMNNIPLMCWECRAMLQKIHRFKERTKAAQKYLQAHGNKMRNKKLLSNLTYAYPNDFIEIVHQEKKDQDIKPKKIEIDIKQEDEFDDKFDEFYDRFDQIDNEEVKYESFDEPKEFEVQVKEEINFEVKDEVDLDVLKAEFCKSRIDKMKARQQKKIMSMESKFKLVLNDKDFDTKNNFRRVVIDEKERLYWADLDKTARNFSIMAYKCNLCISGYGTEEYYLKHMKRFHSESSGELQCDLCHKRFKCKKKLKYHLKQHYFKYICNLCNYETSKMWKIHHHLSISHKRSIVCCECGLKFDKRPDFYKHYNSLHSRFTCDHCQKRFTKKQNLIRHICLRHNTHRCYICQKDYSTRDALTRHNSLHHVIARTEHCYCVECDIQFDNMARYKVHLSTSVKHKPIKGIPCPECPKVYNKRVTMNNHYKFVHLQKTNFYCKKCERYFLNGFRLRQHTASFHDKIRPPKNKLCPHCGRGFQTNRILTNHIRTHTGERPFACDYCPSTFTQQTALKVHMRAIHKVK